MLDQDFHALRQHLETDVRQPAFDVIRSRRLWRTRFLAMTGVALAVVALTVWSITTPPAHNLNSPPVGGSQTVVPTLTLGPHEAMFPFEPSLAYPAVSVVPDTAAPLLPTDRAVGNASFGFGNAQFSNEYLVMRDGRQFKVDPGMGILSMLSPDGRWLALYKDNVTSLRDLTGTTTRPAGITDQAWSANGRFLLGREQTGYAVLDTQTWILRAVPGGRGQWAFGVLDTGDVLLLDGKVAADHVPIRTINPTDGVTVQRFTVDAAGRLRTGETLTRPGGEFGVDLVDIRIGAGYGVVRIHYELRNSPGYLVFSTEDGRVVRRIDIPSEAPTGWMFTGTRLTATDGTSSPGLPSERLDYVVTIDIRDGHFSTLSRIHAPSDTAYLLPGSFQPD